MPTVDLQIFNLINENQKYVPKETIVQQHLDSHYFQFLQIYTDGSKDPETGRTSAAMYIPQFKYKSAKRTVNNISVYAAEMIAIQIALQWVEEIQPTTVVICSDSYSALTSILSGKSESRQDILLEVLQSLYRIWKLRIIATFLWVPAHVGVEGNEEVDKIVKQALNTQILTYIYP